MMSNKKIAVIVGALFLTAMVTSLLGGGLLESLISAPDYLTIISSNKILMTIGIFLELINGVAVLGIAVMMFRILKHVNSGMALGYIGLRIIEAIFCIVSAIIPVLLLALSQQHAVAATPDVFFFDNAGTLLIEMRIILADLLIPISFALGALLFYYLLYQSKLIPRFISVWGFIAAIMVLTLSMLQTGMAVNMILVLPIILNEIFLGIWLITKGFNSVIVVTGFANTDN